MSGKHLTCWICVLPISEHLYCLFCCLFIDFLKAFAPSITFFTESHEVHQQRTKPLCIYSLSHAGFNFLDHNIKRFFFIQRNLLNKVLRRKYRHQEMCFPIYFHVNQSISHCLHLQGIKLWL